MSVFLLDCCRLVLRHLIHFILSGAVVEMIMGVTSDVIGEEALNVLAPMVNHAVWQTTAVM